MMRERPILFSGPMVRAIREGRKTQTRRPVTPQPPASYDRVSEYVYSPTYSARWENDGPPGTLGMWTKRCPYGAPGDRLWVRETWAVMNSPGERAALVYRADRAARNADLHGTKPELLRLLEMTPDLPPVPESVDMTWRPSIHMPRWASRLTLAIEAVRVERLQEISEADARAEGIHNQGDDANPVFVAETPDGRTRAFLTAREAFAHLWDSLNGNDAPWASNPWVWAITFRVLS